MNLVKYESKVITTRKVDIESLLSQNNDRNDFFDFLFLIDATDLETKLQIEILINTNITRIEPNNSLYLFVNLSK